MERVSSSSISNCLNIRPTRFRVQIHSALQRRNRALQTLWTFQPLEVWKRLQAEFALYTDPQLIDVDPLMWQAYKWMSRQMKRRLPHYEGHFPWWAEARKPDLRCFEWWFSEGQGVCLELQLAPSRVLLSDYETWHLVLSRNFVPLNPQEEAEWDQAQHRLRSNGEIDPKYWRIRTRQSWERVFDFEALRSGGMWPGNYQQACFERLNLDDVVAVTELRAR